MPSSIPQGYTSITPYLLVADVAAQVAFLQNAFGATLLLAMPPKPPHRHVEMKVGTGRVMMGPAGGASGGGGHWPAMPAMIHLYVEDADKSYAAALNAGGTSQMPPRDEFYGERTSAVKDLHGNVWWIATQKESLSPDEINRRYDAVHQQG